MTPHEYVNFLSNSSIRYQLLRELAEQPQEPGALAQRCSCSRPTVHRSLKKFQRYNWVRAVENGYEFTPVGERVLQQYDSLLETLSIVMEYPTFFNQLGELGLNIPLSAVETSTVVSSTSENPHAPLNHFTTAIRDLTSERCSVIAPVISPEFIDASQPLLETGTNLELIYDEAIFETVRTEYSAELMTAFDTDQITLYISPKELLFGLVLFDDRVFIHTHDETGQLRTCLESTDPELYAWAMDIYSEYQAAAQQIEDISDFS